MNVLEIAKTYNLSVGIYYISYMNLWQAKLQPGLPPTTDVKFREGDSQEETSVIGEGQNPNEALADLNKAIVGKTLLLKQPFEQTYSFQLSI